MIFYLIASSLYLVCLEDAKSHTKTDHRVLSPLWKGIITEYEVNQFLSEHSHLSPQNHVASQLKERNRDFDC